MAVRSDSICSVGISDIAEEIQVLQSIYIDELDIQFNSDEWPSCISIQLHPATAENTEEQYVCLTVTFQLHKQYPTVVPEIIIRNPRGLAEEEIERMMSNLAKLGDTLVGSPMMYEMIESIKESLTRSNVPHGHCVICMECFHEDEPYTKTACYHYFHRICLQRYIGHVLDMETEPCHSQSRDRVRQPKEIRCPVCRLTIDAKSESAYITSNSPDDAFTYKPDKAMKNLQHEMARLYQTQLKNGGIIDVEVEKNRFLISSGTVFDFPINGTSSDISVMHSEQVDGPSNQKPEEDRPTLDNSTHSTVTLGNQERKGKSTYLQGETRRTRGHNKGRHPNHYDSRPRSDRQAPGSGQPRCKTDRGRGRGRDKANSRPDSRQGGVGVGSSTRRQDRREVSDKRAEGVDSRSEGNVPVSGGSAPHRGITNRYDGHGQCRGECRGEKVGSTSQGSSSGIEGSAGQTRDKTPASTGQRQGRDNECGQTTSSNVGRPKEFRVRSVRVPNGTQRKGGKIMDGRDPDVNEVQSNTVKQPSPSNDGKPTADRFESVGSGEVRSPVDEGNPKHSSSSDKDVVTVRPRSARTEQRKANKRIRGDGIRENTRPESEIVKQRLYNESNAENGEEEVRCNNVRSDDDFGCEILPVRVERTTEPKPRDQTHVNVRGLDKERITGPEPRERHVAAEKMASWDEKTNNTKSGTDPCSLAHNVAKSDKTDANSSFIALSLSSISKFLTGSLTDSPQTLRKTSSPPE